jgi:hypothetical protein
MTLISYIILLSLFNTIFALENHCKNCKFYIPSLIGNNPNLGLCKIFKERPYVDKNIVIHNFAVHCRNDESLCGKDGIFYEPNTNYNDDIIDCKTIIDDDDDEEVKQIKKAFFEVLRKMKKYNTKKIYKIFKGKNNS